MKAKRIYYLISRSAINETPVEAVLDMLRYDGAVVECNAPPGYYLLSSDNRGAPHRARWHSFGLIVSQEGFSLGDLHDWARKQEPPDQASRP